MSAFRHLLVLPSGMELLRVDCIGQLRVSRAVFSLSIWRLERSMDARIPLGRLGVGVSWGSAVLRRLKYFKRYLFLVLQKGEKDTDHGTGSGIKGLIIYKEHSEYRNEGRK